MLQLHKKACTWLQGAVLQPTQAMRMTGRGWPFLPASCPGNRYRASSSGVPGSGSCSASSLKRRCRYSPNAPTVQASGILSYARKQPQQHSQYRQNKQHVHVPCKPQWSKIFPAQLHINKQAACCECCECSFTTTVTEELQETSQQNSNRGCAARDCATEHNQWVPTTHLPRMKAFCSGTPA